MKPVVKGRIAVQLTVFCGRCDEWQYLSATKKGAAYKEARAKGWKLTKKFGWVCPDHFHKR